MDDSFNRRSQLNRGSDIFTTFADFNIKVSTAKDVASELKLKSKDEKNTQPNFKNTGNKVLGLSHEHSTLSGKEQTEDVKHSKRELAARALKKLEKGPVKVSVKAAAFFDKATKTIFVNIEKLTEKEVEEIKKAADSADKEGISVKFLDKQEFKKEVLTTTLVSKHGFKLLEQVHEHYQEAQLKFEQKAITHQTKGKSLQPLFKRHLERVSPLQNRVTVEKSGDFNKNLALVQKGMHHKESSSALFSFSFNDQQVSEERRKDRSKEKEEIQIKRQERQKEVIKEEVKSKSLLKKEVNKLKTKKQIKKEGKGEVEDSISEYKVQPSGKWKQVKTRVDLKNQGSRHRQ